ncbi:MAG: orotidine-5'-phosphate decarboxylase [Chloroflexi bacterium]|nr:orotidine-5'-phosphate decarboxylase [Chloroflexota bacterium]
MNFFENLTKVSQQNKSLLCVGLDPDVNMIPNDRLVAFNHNIIEATFDLACSYKPNLAIYESMGIDGLLALQKTVQLIREANPLMPIIGDGKRGDIGTNSLAYARTLFDTYGFDAVTVNPYMGYDTIKPFLDRKDRGVFILCRTSNPGGMDIQELKVIREGEKNPRTVYEVVAELTLKWNENGNAGLVVGATYPEQILRVRQICPDVLFLIPGVGWQGGDVEKTVHNAVDSQGRGFIINVSRQIMYAAKTPAGTQSTPSQAIKKMRRVARELRNEINSYLPVPFTKSAEPKDSDKETTPPIATTSR